MNNEDEQRREAKATKNRSLPYFVHNPQGVLRGRLATADDAAAFVSLLGNESTVRTARGRVLWKEGDEHDGRAGESYDAAAECIHERWIVNKYGC